ncbi:hypothetical protein QQS21_002615 [Conoideocrella luteorostrata]|uniref:Uncharacterized protein n=1 Tax=Conoideocrella luteorostrata TaxID=1105319 RepID=A0AAJ0CUY6_9HYPO|nr:hypothetical protein QQS21_002615 [Conoideocrella luteorostrata]
MKAGRQCPGYQEIHNWIASSTNSAKAAAEQSNTNIVVAPQIPLEEKASCFFVANWVLLPRKTDFSGFLDCLLPLTRSKTIPTHLHYALSACSIACFGNGRRADLNNYALWLHTKAVAATATALQDAQISKHDSTIATILLLGVFENITPKKIGATRWGNHADAVVKLVVARGYDQLQTKQGRTLFNAIRSQEIVRMLVHQKLPEQDAAWWFTHCADDPLGMCEHLNFCAAQLQARTHHFLINYSDATNHPIKLVELINECRDLDMTLAAHGDSLRTLCDWETVAWQDGPSMHDYFSADVFPGRIDVYGDRFVVRHWNFMRSSRLMLYSTMVRLAARLRAPLDYRSTPEYAVAVKICTDLITDIIASVPYMLGQYPKSKRTTDDQRIAGFGCGNDAGQKCLYGCFLLWPLGCIEKQDYITDSQREWVNGRMDFISNELGLKCANRMVQVSYRIPSSLVEQDRISFDKKRRSGDMPVENRLE